MFLEKIAKKFLIRGLSRNMLFALTLLIFSIIIIMGVSIYINTRAHFLKKFERELLNTNNLIHDMTLTAVETSIKSHLTTIANKNRDIVNYYYQIHSRGEMGYDTAIDSIRKLFLNPAYGRIGTTGYLAVIDGIGKTIIHPKLRTGHDMSNYEFMRRAVALKDGYLEYRWKNPGETDEQDKAAALAFFRPWNFIIWAGSNKSEFTGMVDIRELKKRIAEIKIGKSGYSFVIDMTGKLIVHPKLEGQNIADSRDASGRFFIREILEKKDGSIAYGWKNPGELVASPKLLFYKYIPEMDWVVATGSGFDDLNEQLGSLRNIIIITLIIAFLASVLFVSMMINRFLRPLRVIGEASDRVSEGDLGATIEYHSTDELGEMSRHFNRIVANFAEVLKKIKLTAEQLASSIQDLTVSSREVSTTANQQAAAVREIVSTMEDSDDLSRKIALRIDEVAGTAAETRGMVEKGVSIISSSTEKMDQIQNTNSETIRGIRDLKEQIDGIWEVIGIINGIADQTKIIAFNAELEAAAAGEQGRNFQIVAGEVRRLADNTFTSTAEVKSKIEDIQNASEVLALSSETGTERIREGGALTMKLREIFGEIRNSAEVSAASSGQIALSIKQQVAAFEQILLTLKQISSGIGEFTSSARSTTGAAEALKSVSTELEELLGRYRT